MELAASKGGRGDGTRDAGDIHSHMFAKDGETSYSVRHPTWAFRPVANMLEFSPPLSLSVDHDSEDGMSAEDKERLLLVLEHRDRIRHLRFFFPVRYLQELVMAINEGFPILEYSIVGPWTEDSTALMLPEILQAPNLRYLFLHGFACPIRSRSHPPAVGLVTLYILINHPPAYFPVITVWSRSTGRH